jgi:hypothetical protein
MPAAHQPAVAQLRLLRWAAATAAALTPWQTQLQLAATATVAAANRLAAEQHYAAVLPAVP